MNTLETETLPSHLNQELVSRAKKISSEVSVSASNKNISNFPKVFDYKDYRVFLRDWFQQKKGVQPSFSGALFAKKAGLNSHSLLSMVIRGERNLSPATIRNFSRALEFQNRESQYFEKLVLFCQSKNSDDKSYYLHQLQSLAQGQGKVMFDKIQNHASYLSHWYVVAIRELVATPDFKPDPDWMSVRLKRKITRKQAEEAWNILIELKMVTEDPVSHKFKIAHPKLEIDPGSVDFAIRHFHKSYLERAKESIDGEKLEERELSSHTVAIGTEDLNRLKEKVKEFRKQLNLEFPADDSSRGQVVAVNMQVLVLTQSTQNQKERRKEEVK